jgi:hypothetical protein
MGIIFTARSPRQGLKARPARHDDQMGRLLAAWCAAATATTIVVGSANGAASPITCPSFVDAAATGSVRFSTIRATDVGCTRAKQVLRAFAKAGPTELTTYLGFTCNKLQASSGTGGAVVKCRQAARASISARETGG